MVFFFKPYLKGFVHLSSALPLRKSRWSPCLDEPPFFGYLPYFCLANFFFRPPPLFPSYPLWRTPLNLSSVFSYLPLPNCGGHIQVEDLSLGFLSILPPLWPFSSSLSHALSLPLYPSFAFPFYRSDARRVYTPCVHPAQFLRFRASG